MRRVLILFLIGVFFLAIGMSAGMVGPGLVKKMRAQEASGEAPVSLEQVAGNSSHVIPRPNVPSRVTLPRVNTTDPMTPEEIVRYADIISTQQEYLDKQKSEVNRQVAHLTIVEQDLAGSRLAMDGMRHEIEELVGVAETLMSKLHREQKVIDDQRDEIDVKLEKLDSSDKSDKSDDLQNVRTLAGLFQNMPPATAAEYFTELSDEGKMELVVKILDEIEERNGAKILAAMSPKLAASIADAFSQHRRITPPKKKRP